MKTSLVALAALVLTGHLALGLEIPSNVRSSAELEKAQADATARKKPIALVQSNKNSTCPYTIGGTTDAMKEFRTKTVMVYVDSTEVKSLPANVQTALGSVRSFPRTVIMDASLTNVIATAGYSRDPAEQQKIFKEATKKIREGGTGGTSAAAGNATDSFSSFFNKPAK